MKRISSRAALAAVAYSLLLGGCCYGPGAAVSPLCEAITRGKGIPEGPVASECTFDLADGSAGAASAQTASCAIPEGAPQLLSATFAYPAGFSVSPDGFLARGEAPAGRYIVDLDLDGAPTGEFPILASGRSSAWVDLDEDGGQDFWEPEVFRSVGRGSGGPLLRINTQFGGDDNTLVNVANVGFRATIEIAAGIFFNPTIPGEYDVVATFQGVDPDTGGPSNGDGTAPTELTLEMPVEVGALLKDGFELRP
ncbi:MAG: hypothetical protein AAGE01_02965 [Pseudomonadota bacterium]